MRRSLLYFWSLLLLLLAVTPVQVFAQSALVLVDASITREPVSAADFGLNVAAWDSQMTTPSTLHYLNSLPCRAFRYPGGSWADGFDWTKSRYDGMPMTSDLGALVERYHGIGDVIINYGSGSPQMAEAWAAYCDGSTASKVLIGDDVAGRDWKTVSFWAKLRGQLPLTVDDGLNKLRAGHASPWKIAMFEVGNECYGSWEYDTHLQKQDPVLYAQFYATVDRLIHKVAPGAKVGAVVTATEDDWGDAEESVVNRRTKQIHTGWTPVMLSTLHAESIMPDFVIYHYYPEDPGKEDDQVLLHSSAAWESNYGAIHSMLADYLGPKGSSVEVDCTENNSVADNPGKQSTSIVDGLYLADSFGAIINTSFRSYYWWDLHNGIQSQFNNAPSLFGWRQYGDYGILSPGDSQLNVAANSPYPTYFAYKLIGKFCSPGDVPVKVTTTNPDLAVYAVTSKTKNISLLIVNNDPTNALPSKFELYGCRPSSKAIAWTYGLSQDTAAEQGHRADLQLARYILSNKALQLSIPPYSMTVIRLY
jgi:alpha-L-arabinofuranosidase